MAARRVRSSPTQRRPCRRRWAERAFSSRRRIEYAANAAGALAFDDDLRSRIIAGQPAPAGRLGDDHIIRQLGVIVRGGIPDLAGPDSSPRSRGRPARPSSAGIRPRSPHEHPLIIQRYGTGSPSADRTPLPPDAERASRRCTKSTFSPPARDYVTWKNEYPERIRSDTRCHRAPLRERAHLRSRSRSIAHSEWISATPSPAPTRSGDGSNGGRGPGATVLRWSTTLRRRQQQLRRRGRSSSPTSHAPTVIASVPGGEPREGSVVVLDGPR